MDYGQLVFSRRTVWWSLLWISLCGCSTSSRPHIIYILADDLGWNDVSFHGSLQIPTPNMDAIAGDGVILNNYYVTPLCTPSRASLLTGKYAVHVGLQHFVIQDGERLGLPLDVVTMPTYLKRLGYSTHILGKWHLGFFMKEYTPLFRGFDSHFGFWGGKLDYYDHTRLFRTSDRRLKGLWGLDLRDNMKVVEDSIGQYSTDLFTARAEDIIRTHNKSQPIFLFFSQAAVHTANDYTYFQSPARYSDKFLHISDAKRRIFAGMVAALDDSVGRIFHVLYEEGMLDNSIFILSSDNGAAVTGFQGGVGSNWPLRGSKGTLWEGGVRAVSFLWSPLLEVPGGRVASQMAHITDWLPTLYSAAGGDVQDLGELDGVDLWQTLSRDQPSPRSEILLNIDSMWGVAALRQGHMKVVIGSSFGGKFEGWFGPSGRDNPSNPNKTAEDNSLAGVVLSRLGRKFGSVTDRWRQTLEIVCGNIPSSAAMDCRPTEHPCLFNVTADPCEYNNLAGELPEVLDRLMHRLKKYNDTAVPPLTSDLDIRASPRFHNYVYNAWVHV